MTTTSSRPTSSRRQATLASLATTLAVALPLAVGAGLASAKDDGTGPAFAPQWQEHAAPLLYHGQGLVVGTTAWLVPRTLPRGTYRVFTRDEHNEPHLVDGQRFVVSAGDVYKDINLMMSTSEHSPEAIDERYVVLPPAMLR